MDNYNSTNTPNTQMYPPNSPDFSNYQPQPIQPLPSQRNNNIIIFVIIVVLALLAIGGMIFGASTFISNSQEIISLNEKISEQDSIIKNNIALPTTTDSDTRSYIYIGEWGVKIKIPEDLSWVGYSFTPSDKTTSVSVYGAKGQFDTRPAFLNTVESSGGLGFITRAPAGYGSVDGILVLSSGGYDYFYTALQVIYSVDSNDIELETTSRDLVQTMLTTAENYSAI